MHNYFSPPYADNSRGVDGEQHQMIQRNGFICPNHCFPQQQPARLRESFRGSCPEKGRRTRQVPPFEPRQLLCNPGPSSLAITPSHTGGNARPPPRSYVARVGRSCQGKASLSTRLCRRSSAVKLLLEPPDYFPDGTWKRWDTWLERMR